ncbi:Hypothetical protein I595_48 [Croceitalea dokdonensis DOKDO 023]|uniref:Uncharacterized protein n=1 Tax=Croceitalea dokdonensis DOKDO 023 TaxID=1300341 RepID=A0A0P7B3N0_9FLAO|nr:YdeI/OmpD-associated family protein [Croceitalea dokdonensis]KPM33146.1 Hypothetical protein I595_48 [Croceitalea dokdonensis DOKDO 023]
MWSKVNKDYLLKLEAAGLMYDSGQKAIHIAKENGSWTALDDVEKGIIPNYLKLAFKANSTTFKNYLGFTKEQQKSYLYCLNQAKREAARQKRIAEIISLGEQGTKYHNNG